jgi:hypothetical protein
MQHLSNSPYTKHKRVALSPLPFVAESGGLAELHSEALVGHHPPLALSHVLELCAPLSSQRLVWAHLT